MRCMRCRKPWIEHQVAHAAIASRARSCPPQRFCLKTATPATHDIDDAMRRQICARCCTYPRIREASRPRPDNPEAPDMGRLKTITPPQLPDRLGRPPPAAWPSAGLCGPQKPHANSAARRAAGQGETPRFTPYVLINADGVTLITPRADKGQECLFGPGGLIAEELDVRTRTSPGRSPPANRPAYWNTAARRRAAAFMVPERRQGGTSGPRRFFPP